MTKLSKLQSIKDQMDADDALPLKKGATRLVFGDGSPDAKILFIGEGPGYWEDQKGIPFVGRAGAFLNQLLATIKLDRKKVFVTNVVHHRPPNNRDPQPNELLAYGQYLDKIITVISPKVIVTLGRFSMAKFLPGVTITQMHGKPEKVKFNESEVLVVPMYHPAAGLRNGEIKRRTVEDFERLPSILAEYESAQNEKQKEEKKKAEQLGFI
jgi:DNA polymerase